MPLQYCVFLVADIFSDLPQHIGVERVNQRAIDGSQLEEVSRGRQAHSPFPSRDTAAVRQPENSCHVSLSKAANPAVLLEAIRYTFFPHVL
jgi:hypothetical protein